MFNKPKNIAGFVIHITGLKLANLSSCRSLFASHYKSFLLQLLRDVLVNVPGLGPGLNFNGKWECQVKLTKSDFKKLRLLFLFKPIHQYLNQTLT